MATIANVKVTSDHVKKILSNIHYFTKKTALVGIPESENARSDTENFNKKVEIQNKKIREKNKISELKRRESKSKSNTKRQRLNKKTIGNAELAFMFENGTARMAARPHFGPGIENAQGKILSALKEGAQKGLTNKNALDKSLVQAALAGMASVKKAIDNVRELKPSTLKQREREGFKGTKPLRRTGKYINSIKGIVRDR